MQIEPDPYRLAQLNTRNREQRSGLWWVTVIIVGVFVGNLLSFGASQLYVRWELKQLTISLDAMTQRQAAELRVQQERSAKQNAAARIEREKRNAVNAKLLQTCAYWKREVAKESNSQTRAYRDTACARAARPSR